MNSFFHCVSRSNKPPVSYLKKSPRSYQNQKFIAESTFTENDFLSNKFSSRNIVHKQFTDKNLISTNFSSLNSNFTNSSHIFKQTRPRRKPKLNEKSKNLDPVFNPPAIPNKKQEFAKPVTVEKTNDNFKIPKPKKKKTTKRKKLLDSKVTTVNQLQNTDTVDNQKVVTRLKSDKVKKSGNQKIPAQKLPIQKNSTQKNKPQTVLQTPFPIQRTVPAIPLRNERLYYSIDCTQTTSIFDSNINNFDHSILDSSKINKFDYSKSKIQPIFKQPVLNMDKKPNFIGINSSPKQKVTLDVKKVNETLENLLLENPSRRANSEMKNSPTFKNSSDIDYLDDELGVESVINTEIDEDLDPNLSDESDHDLPVTPPNEKKAQVSPYFQTKFPNHCESTIRFIRSKEEVPDSLKLSTEQISMLKWQGSKICPKILRGLLAKTGFKIFKTTKQWIGYYGKHMKSPLFEKFQAGQNVNHFPGTFELGRKDRLFRNVNRLAAKRSRNVSSHKTHMVNSNNTFTANQISQGSSTNFNSIYNPNFHSCSSSYNSSTVINTLGSKFIPKPQKFILENFDFLPQTYILPQDRDQLRREWSDGTRFISKPCASARGIGIKVLNKFSQLPTVFKNERLSASTKRKLLVQKYLAKPMLLNGHKFDLHTVYKKVV